jgi:hypothetical protein
MQVHIVDANVIKLLVLQASGSDKRYILKVTRIYSVKYYIQYYDNYLYHLLTLLL